MSITKRVAWAMIVLGCLLSYLSIVRTFQRGREVMTWPETTCVIHEAKVVEDDEGGTWRLKLRMTHVVDGAVHESSRYDLRHNYVRRGQDSTLGDSLLEAGAVPCYYDPDDPDDAIIDRSPPRLGPLSFLGPGLLIFGLALLIDAAIRRRYLRARQVHLRSWNDPEPGGGYRLRQAPLEILGVAFCTLLALPAASMCYGALTFVSDAGRGYWAVIVFGLITLGFVGLAIAELLGLLGPWVTLEIDEPWIPVGGRKRLRWVLHGVAPAIREVRIRLRAREELLGANGESRTHQLHYLDVARLETSARSGIVELSIPPDTMHTFVSEHHHLIWELEMEVEIAYWPDERSRFELTVGPAEEARS